MMSNKSNCRKCYRCTRTIGMYGISYICNSSIIQKYNIKGYIDPDKIKKCPHYYKEMLNNVIYKKSKKYGVLI